MGKTVIAGTVMLTLTNGQKKFLVKIENEEQHFVYTESKPEMTGLASLLDELKTKVNLDINSLLLLELTNGVIFEKNVPIFIFETKEENSQKVIPDNYQWRSYEEILNLVKKFEIEGMPKFD